MRVEIDSHSGFCGGVIRAIGTAEKYLHSHGGRLYSLGAIVHNEEELSRLASLGLVCIDSLDGRSPVLIRAHGEPPSIYRKAQESGIELIDCTCPVVLKLQGQIREAYARLSASGGSLVIFGKTGHPEVLGLMGQVNSDVTVIQSLEELKPLLEKGMLPVDKDIELFSQTTMSPSEYERVYSYLQSSMRGASLTVHNTICSQVSSRHKELMQFARNHDVIVFVSGKESSNGKVLYELCRSVNPRTYHIVSPEGLDPGWFDSADSAGVCGATSTPKWLLENVSRAIENLH